MAGEFNITERNIKRAEPPQPWTVLIWPGGNEIGLEVRQSLMARREVQLVSASECDDDAASFLYLRHFVLPYADEEGCLEALLNLIEHQGVDFIFPTHPVVIDFLNTNRPLIPAKLVLASEDCVTVTRSKRATFERLQDQIPLPALFSDEQSISAWPVFVKPNQGFGSKGAQVVETAQDLAEIASASADLIIQEYLPGDEYTVDCFSAHGRLVFAGARRRDRIWTGLAVQASRAPDSIQRQMEGYATLISRVLQMDGPWFFQMKEDAGGKLKLLEVEARMAGSMVFHRAQGTNFALLALYHCLGRQVDVLTAEKVDAISRHLKTNYKTDIRFDRLYIDLDDTLIIHGRVHGPAITLIFQCINNAVKCILITKNPAEDISDYLQRFRLDGLFDEVIQVPNDARKSDYIDPANAIFIDDSYAEREEVSGALGIPVFDVSSLDVLLTDRI